MQMNTQAVICTVDFSPPSPLVIHYGVAAAKKLGASLYLFHAVNDPQDGTHPTTLFERGGELSTFTEHARSRMKALMEEIHLGWEPVVRFGDPVEELTDFVGHHPKNLVVSASHGVSGFRRLFVGTVVERMSRSLPCPLLVVRPGSRGAETQFDGFNNILIGCDEPGGWRQVAPLISRLRSDSPLRIHLARSIERPVDMVELDEETAPYHQAQEKLQARLEGVLWHEGKKVFPTAESLSSEVTSSVPQEMLLHAAQEMKPDLIVVGVRHSGTVGRMISGSTTEALLRRAPCDVLVFPEITKNDGPEPGHEIDR